MSKKPELVDVLEVLKLQAEARDLYNKVDELVSKMLQEFGDGRYDYHLEASPPDYEEFIQGLVENGDYLKFELVDNVKALAAGDQIWKSVGIKPVMFSSRSLKRCPESLK